MYLVWYILLNVIIFGVFIFPVLYYLNFINFKNFYKVVYTKSINKNVILLFKNLYLEYIYFAKTNNVILKNYLIFIQLNLKTLNLSLVSYNPFLNYFIMSNTTKNFNCNKLNLNFYKNTLQPKQNYKFFYLKKLVNYSKYYNLNLNFTILDSVKISKKFQNTIQNKWVTKYSPSNFIKYINILNTSTYNILFLRKNKVFNKGRYSRNRQYYRTGVYWCLYVNIIAVVGIYFWFYRFTMNFGYLWWLLYLFIISFILPKTIKFRLYNISILYNTYILNFIWLFNILNRFLIFFINLYKFLLNWFLNLNTFYLYKMKSFFLFSFFNFFFNFLKNFNFFNFNYLNVFEYKFINNNLK